MVTLQTRPGVTQSFFIADMGERKPEAAALLFAGAGGNIRLRVEDGQIKLRTLNLWVRSRSEFVRNGILPVIIDAPGDRKSGDGMTDGFRESAAHVLDVRAVAGEVRRRYPGTPLFVVGHSRGTVSAAHLAVALESELAGAVLSASKFGSTQRPVLVLFDWSKIKIPLLFVHHVDDGCVSNPYFAEAARLGRRFPLITVSGGKPAEGPPCGGLSQHNFFGKEAETVDAIAAWMLGKPFLREIN
jgi:hypothetical protein